MSSKTGTPPVGVRLTEDLRKYVEGEAKKNFRSTSSEIAMRVERTRQQDLAKQQPQGAQQ